MFLLPLGPPESLPELLCGEQDVRWIYGAGCHTRITAQADALFFVREATPLPEGYRDLVIPGLDRPAPKTAKGYRSTWTPFATPELVP